MLLPVHDLVKGMRVDLRDECFIWSAARILSVCRSTTKPHNNDNKKKNASRSVVVSVVIRCDGWGPEWDEQVQVPTPRLAPLYTFTRQVKCLVSILHKAKKKPLASQLQALPSTAVSRRTGFSTCWPARVQFRMPHPVRDATTGSSSSTMSGRNSDDVNGTEEQCLDAEVMLTEEQCIYIQPYAAHLLPPYVAKLIVNHDSKKKDDTGGMWLKAAKHLRLWKEVPEETGVLHPNFAEAWECANADTTIVGVLGGEQFPLQAGTLLLERYRVFSQEGYIDDMRDGCLIDWSEHQTPEYVARRARQHINDEDDNYLREDADASEDDDDDAHVNSCVQPASLPADQEESDISKLEYYASSDSEVKPLAFVGGPLTVNSNMDDACGDDSSVDSIVRALPPTLPPPIYMTESLFPGVKQCITSNEFLAFVNMGGNDVILGTFPTQTQAYQATQLSQGRLSEDDLILDTKQARHADLNAVAMETVIDAFEQQYEPAIDFSLHDWTLDTIAERCRNNNNNNNKLAQDHSVEPTSSTETRQSKRKGIPRKVDLAKRRYITP